MRLNNIIISSILLILIISVNGTAQIPNEVNFQGRMTDNLGENVADGLYDVTFRLYEDSIGGSPVWEETHQVNVKDGVFSARLGGIVPPLPPGCLHGKCKEYLELVVEGEAQSPRIKLTKSFFAGSSENVTGDIVTSPGKISAIWPSVCSGSPDTNSMIEIVADSVKTEIGMFSIDLSDLMYRTVSINADTGNAGITIGDVSNTENYSHSISINSSANGSSVGILDVGDLTRDSSVIKSGSLSFLHSEDGGISVDTTLFERNRVYFQDEDSSASFSLNALRFLSSDDGGISFDTTLIYRNGVLFKSDDMYSSYGLGSIKFNTGEADLDSFILSGTGLDYYMSSDSIRSLGPDGIFAYDAISEDTTLRLNSDGLVLYNGSSAAALSPSNFILGLGPRYTMRGNDYMYFFHEGGTNVLDVNGLMFGINPSGDTTVNLQASDGDAWFDGDVGIGTHIPSEALEVNGTVYSSSGGFKFPDASVQSSATTNCGASQEFSGGSVTAPDVADSPIYKSISCPTDGYILAMFCCEAYSSHVTGTETELQVGLSMISGSFIAADEKRWQVPSSCPSGQYGTFLSLHHIFPASQGDTAIYVTIRRNSGASGITLADYVLSLVFIPESYGTFTKADNKGMPESLESSATINQAIKQPQSGESEIDALRTRITELEEQLGAIKSSFEAVKESRD